MGLIAGNFSGVFLLRQGGHHNGERETRAALNPTPNKQLLDYRTLASIHRCVPRMHQVPGAMNRSFLSVSADRRTYHHFDDSTDSESSGDTRSGGKLRRCDGHVLSSLTTASAAVEYLYTGTSRIRRRLWKLFFERSGIARALRCHSCRSRERRHDRDHR